MLAFPLWGSCMEQLCKEGTWGALPAAWLQLRQQASIAGSGIAVGLLQCSDQLRQEELCNCKGEAPNPMVPESCGVSTKQSQELGCP